MTDFPLSLLPIVLLRAFITGLVFLPAFIPLLFINLPVAATLELMILTFIIYLVILPGYSGGWKGMNGEDGVVNRIEGNPNISNYCGDQLGACIQFFQGLYELPIGLTFTMVGAGKEAGHRSPLLCDS